MVMMMVNIKVNVFSIEKRTHHTWPLRRPKIPFPFFRPSNFDIHNITNPLNLIPSLCLSLSLSLSGYLSNTSLVSV
jgi:hypothetical protein